MPDHAQTIASEPKMTMPSRTYLILAIFFAIVGTVVCIRWGLSTGTLTEGALVNFLPATAFFGAYALSRRGRRRGMNAVVIAVCLAAVAFWGAIAIGVEFIIAATTEVTSVRRYDDILDKHWGTDKSLVSHFPRPIPSDARDVRFSYLPAFLQGGAHVQLRYATSPDAVSDLHARFAAIRTGSFMGGDWSEHANAKGGMPTTFFHTSGGKDRSFPDDYEIMVFDRLLTEEERKAESWNHGRSRGVAISLKRNEIVYWAELW